VEIVANMPPDLPAPARGKRRRDRTRSRRKALHDWMGVLSMIALLLTVGLRYHGRSSSPARRPSAREMPAGANLLAAALAAAKAMLASRQLDLVCPSRSGFS